MAFQVRYPILGSNYYPEAWDRSLIDEDLNLMQELGLNCVRIAEFAWKTMEPEEGKYDFSLFREVVDKCNERGIAVIMGTPTACPPRWLEEKYPEIFLVANDGTKMVHGARRNVCPNNEIYRAYCVKIVEAMAKEFANDENIIGWQIDNEIQPELGANKFMGCCCPVCKEKFNTWMQNRYNGDIDALNREWGNYVFSQQYDRFDQFDTPHPTLWTHPSYSYHYGLFQNDSQQEFIKLQYDVLKKYVSCPVGHDSMPIFNLDYNELSRNMDVMQYNHYCYGDIFWETHFWYDFLRPMKDRPFWNTETSCCWNGSAVMNYMRPKNFNIANVWLGVFAGAELTNYWLWRSHYGGQELMHGSCISSAGRPLQCGKEIKKLSQQFDLTSGLINGTKPVSNKIGIYAPFTAYEMSRFQGVAPDFTWKDAIRFNVYKPLFDAHLSPEILVPRIAPDNYEVIMTPFAFNLDEENLGERLLEWTKNGGTWIVGPMTDIRNRAGAKYTHSPYGILEKVASVRNEFTLPKGTETHTLSFKNGTTGGIVEWYMDALRVQKDAKVVASYVNGDFINGYAAITETPYGKGKIVVLGALPDATTLVNLITSYASEKGVTPVINCPSSLAVVKRSGEVGELICITETTNNPTTLVAPFNCIDALSGKTYAHGETISVNPYDVLILKKK